MFIISNLILICIFVSNGTREAANQTLNKLPPIVYYTQDYTTWKEEVDQGIINTETDPLPSISIETAIELSQSEFVQSYDINTIASCFIPTIKPFQLNTPSQIIEQTHYFDLIGTSSTELKLASKTMELTSGRGITETDIEQFNQVVIIEEHLAKSNNLSVGDLISIDFNYLQTLDESKESTECKHEFEIIGTYQNTTFDASEVTALEESASQLYIPYNVSYTLTGEALDFYITSKFGINAVDSSQVRPNKIGYLLKDPLTLYDFIEDSNSLLPSKYHLLLSGDASYDSIVQSVKNIMNSNQLIIQIIFVAGIVILSLITGLTLKSREYEIGILLALGENKLKIIGQFIAELIMIAFISFSLSIFSGQFIAKFYAEKLFQREIETASIQSNSVDLYLLDQLNTSASVEFSDFISGFNIEIHAMIYFENMIYGLLIVSFSAFIPICFILHYKPKSILTRR